MTKPAKIVLGVGGGIAAFKAAALASQLVQREHEVHVAMTASAQQFIGALTFEGLTGRRVIVTSTQIDADGRAPHIDATRDADLMIVAPATANTLGKLASGLCDDPVTLLAIACRCPRLLCPAMNDAMWEDSIVQRNVEELRGHGYVFAGPDVGHLAEGYDAPGRMVEPEAIVEAAHSLLA